MATYGTVNADVIQSGTTGLSIGPGNATRFKNRIINGDCRIDQRNAGASVTISGASSAYIVDRFWAGKDTSSGTFTVQQNQGSTTPPTGFTNYAGITTGTAFTAASGDGTYLQQRIEGFNIADLAWGTANAQTVTLSFWVRSSLTGTFSGSLGNSAFNRSYPYSYTISAANTWEQKTITIAGDTSGTWLTTNGIGIRCYWNLGSGSSFLGTGGAWAGAAYLGTTGSVALSQTAGATFYITGVQLEVGSNATGFEYVDYTTQLAMCYRYCYKISGSTLNYTGPLVVITSVGGNYPSWIFPQLMRVIPTVVAAINNGSGATFEIGAGGMFQNGNNSQDSAFGFTATAEL